MNDIPFGFGAHPSKEDPRTISHTDITLGAPVPPAALIDYSDIPHKNQMKVGICTAACVTALAEKQFGTAWRGSMEWLYKIGKVFIDGNMDEGSSIFTMLKAAQKYGIPSESKYPSDCNRSYAEFMSDTNITQEMLDDASLHKIGGYVSVPLTADALMQAIYTSKCGLATRMSVGSSWWTDEEGNATWDKDKLQPLRAPQSVVSGHAIGQVGYQANQDLLLIDRNSWSEQWCDNGDVSFYFKTQAPYFTEAWTITDKVLFTKDLRMGQSGPDVMRLQQFLNTHGFPVALSGIGSSGNETFYFGLATFNALKKAQQANNIPATGYFGPITRAWANKLL